jgi:hypothetical protein
MEGIFFKKTGGNPGCFCFYELPNFHKLKKKKKLPKWILEKIK